MNKDEIELFKKLIEDLVQVSKKSEVLEGKHDRMINDLTKKFEWLEKEIEKLKWLEKEIEKLKRNINEENSSGK